MHLEVSLCLAAAIVSTTCVALRSGYTAAEDSCFHFNAVSKQDPLGPQ